MTSRLERIVALLETGSSVAVRQTAAKQLGDIAQRFFPTTETQTESVKQEFRHLTTHHRYARSTYEDGWANSVALVYRILPFLASKSMETRLAAVDALNHIAEAVPLWYPETHGEQPDQVMLDPAVDVPGTRIQDLDIQALTKSKEKRQPDTASSGVQGRVASKRRRIDKEPVPNSFLENLGIDSTLVKSESLSDADVDDEIEAFTETQVSIKASSKRPERAQNGPRTSIRPELPPLRKRVKREDSDVESKAEIAPVNGGQDVDLKPLPRRPGRPKGSKNKVHSASLPSSPSSSALLAEEDDIFRGLSGRQVLMLKRKLKSNVVTKEQAKDEAMRMRSGGDVSSPASTAEGHSLGSLDLQAVADGGILPGSSLTSDDTKPVLPEPSPALSTKTEPGVAANTSNVNLSKQDDSPMIDYSRSIWAPVIQHLVSQLRHDAWEARHGSSLALRDLIRLHGESYGMKDNLSESQNQWLRDAFLGSLAAVLLEMLAVDRFGDFVGDQVVAPVREAGSQALASLMRHLDLKSIAAVHSILQHMVLQEWISSKVAEGKGLAISKHIWELRHAGLLGLKYELAVRPDLISGEVPGMDGDESHAYMEGVLRSSLLGLADADDDVRAVSAACLLPIAGVITERLSHEALMKLLDVLWNTFLEETDELNSSIASVMELLSRLLATSRVIEIYVKEERGARSLRQLIPRLFPYFRHTISTVRVSVVRTISAFLCAEKLPNGWITPQIVHLLFRNILLEERPDVRHPTIQAWNHALRLAQKSDLGKTCFEPFIQEWFNLALIPTVDGYPQGAFAVADNGIRKGAESHNIDRGVMSSDFSLVSEDLVFHNRIDAIVALSKVSEIGDANIVFANLVSSFLMSTSSHQLTLCGIFVQEWAQINRTPIPFADILPDASRMITALAELTERGTPEAYYEITQDLTSIKQEMAAIRSTFEQSREAPNTSSPVKESISLADVKKFIGSTFDDLMQASSRRSNLNQQLVDRKIGLETAVLQFERSRVGMDNRVATSAASALVWMKVTPPRLNPIIQNVMKGIKNEPNSRMQKRAANAIAVFIENCLDPKTALPAAPVSKIVNNLASFLCQDPVRTPSFTVLGTISGIYALQEERKLAESRKAMADTAQYAGVTFDEKANAACAGDGAERALEAISNLFKDDLFEKVPRLFEIVSAALSGAHTQNWNDLSTEKGQDVIDCLTVLQALVPCVSPGLHGQLSSLLLPLLDVLCAPRAILRNVAAKTLATMCETMPTFGMLFIIEKVLPMLGDAVNEVNRSGAMEAIYYVVQRLQIKVLPYILFLVIPVLGRMSDGSSDIRLLATSVFATLIKLMPLEEGIPDPEGLPPKLLTHREKEREFLKQLMNNRKVDPYVIPVHIKAELRPYQRDGVSWLAFLAKYQLHGILCDDMGLGKSLQTICIISSKHHERRLLCNSTGSPNLQPLQSLIVCPPTLIGHWFHEILKFSDNLRPFKYFGSTKDRESLRGQISQHDVIITSYEVIRADIDTLKQIPFLYCVLDEGHTIKNGKSKLSIAIKTLQSNHRIILSGTPIQNNVLELWNLFDFLMPGFLGSEKQFNDRFSKPILANREGKASSKQSEAATLALDALHKQVLPFLLRRLKEDVLDDLPPKIIQDYYCELSSVQKLLYDEFHSSRAVKEIQEVIVQDTDSLKTDNAEPQKHVFQTLQFLRKLCNHPLLAVNQDVALYRKKVQEAWLKDKEHTPKDPLDLAHCPKLVALRQLLLDCGIGHDLNGADDLSAIDTTANHRVLIFAQTKQMLDIIQHELFAKAMPSVSFMRLDGSTEPLSRHDIVQTFNNDPSVDVLLLTTSVGGLGLTLTGADTVIFIDHDWNPMKDAQAMDRAHRIGQKKVVNVYRLITRGTLEEKIMSLQKFKLNIANTVVNEQNSGLGTMNTDQLLDLFDADTGDDNKRDQPQKRDQAAKSHALEGLAELPAEDEYQNLSLDNFLAKY